MSETKAPNPMGTKPIPKLLMQLAIPAVIANLVNAVYNIVDQIFIGHTIGFLGNAATNIAFPLTTVCLAVGVMTGLGGASGYNLELGRQNPEKAKRIAGTAFSSMFLFGILIAAIVRLFLQPIMIGFGATPNILEYAMTYASVTSLGIPFLMFCTGGNALVRGDGSSAYSMVAIVSGAVINIILDALFMYVFHWGIAGAAWATVIGQALSATLLALYIPRFRGVSFTPKDFIPDWKTLLHIYKLGFSSFVFQSSNLIVQITVNNLLRTYGALSVYGSDIPIAVVGIFSKINAIFIAVVIGVVQGSQPICSFNYGAKMYRRVRQTVRLLLCATTILSAVICLVIECFPRPIIGIFGGGNDLYFDFAVKYARIFAMMMCLNGIQISSSTFFPSIGKPWKGAVISLSKQLLILIPLLILLSSLMGIFGIAWAVPITDTLSFFLSVSFLLYEMRHMPKENQPIESVIT